MKLLNRFRVGFSHLREHKFRHNFLDTDDPFCNCSSNAIETTGYFLLHCPIFASPRKELFDNLRNKGNLILPISTRYLEQILIFGDKNFDEKTNHTVLHSVAVFLVSTKRF